MKIRSLPHIGLTIGCLLLLLLSCKPATTPAPAPAQNATSTSTSTPPASPTPARTATPITPTPSMTPAQEPVAFTFLVTSLQQPGKWNLQLPYTDPGAPELIKEAPDGYRLDPAFRVERIEMLYRWFGIGDRVWEYRRIELRDSHFWSGDTAIAPGAVDRLVQSLTHLRPQPVPLHASTHTDDYPSWDIELTDGDGNHVYLYSNSNTPDFAPWIILYNGRIYAQFDGQVAAALPGLADIAEGQPLASVYGPDREASYFDVNTFDVRLDLPKSYQGLLPLTDSFSYKPDSQQGALLGSLRFYGYLGGIAKTLSGSIVELQKIEVEAANGQSISCALGTQPENEPGDLFYTFSCPVTEPGASGLYRYPVRVTFSTSTDQPYIVSGELIGRWEAGTLIPAASYPEEIGEILEASPLAADLLTDHQILVLSEIAAADPLTGRLDHRWKAEVALLGQVSIGERVLPYSVSINVKIEDGKLVQWDLDRSELQALLQDVLNLAVTSRFLTDDPNLVLNLNYGENPENQMVWSKDFSACAGIPLPGDLPAPGKPLRGFAFNRSWEFYQMQIIMTEDGFLFDSFTLRPSKPEDAVWLTLLPGALHPQAAPPLDSLTLSPGSQWLVLSWDENASASEIKAYEAVFESWQGEKERREHGFALKQAMLRITETGQIILVYCGAP